ncbi:MAG: hypothetical protein JWM74_4020 [Myxococcaceae bacterium]|nr:hypothetical protein [Myxococcaceae bacterium]
MKLGLRKLATGATLATVCLGLGCSSNAATETVGTSANALVARPSARLYLTGPVVTRLKARAAANDAAWTALKAQCDGYATGTMNAPSATAYPNFPNVGQGYQGEEYVTPIMSLGLCFRTTEGVDAAAAARYGAAGARLLDAMSTPASSGGQSPATDSGYGIRNYGVGMAVGYDWLYPALTPSTRERVIASLNSWIDWYDVSGFSRDHSVGNYFIGYLLAKTTTALATEGENAKAAGYWSDVETRMWGQLVKPQFSTAMAGGGWPEGWGYGPRAVRGVAEFLWAVKTAKNLDWAKDVPQIKDQANYVSYFAWPSLKHMDDQGTVRSGTNIKPSAQLATSLAMILEYMGDPGAPTARAFASDVLKTSGDDSAAWQSFLYWDPTLAQTDYKTRPLSYAATGPGHIAMRSTWATDASWGALSSGTYINSPDSGEEMFNQGSLSVVSGDNPVLVNATGWIPQTAGSAGEDFVYNDTWGSKDRTLYNTFFVADATNPYSPGQAGLGPSEAQTHLERVDEQVGFVRSRAAKVEQMYGNAVKPVQQFTRDLVFVRPGVFVLFDRTSIANAAADQWLGFHTAAAPVSAATADSSQKRFDVQKAGATIGSIRTLLPKGASTTQVSLPGGVVRLEEHATGAQQDWLTVVTTTGATPEQQRISTADGNVVSGGVVGVNVQSARNQVVLFPADHAGTSTTSAAKYTVAATADADHILVDVAPSASGYAVTATVSGSNVTVDVRQGGSFKPSAQGSLSFTVTKAGAVTPTPFAAAAAAAAAGGGTPGGGTPGAGAPGAGAPGAGAPGAGTPGGGTSADSPGSAATPSSGEIDTSSTNGDVGSSASSGCRATGTSLPDGIPLMLAASGLFALLKVRRSGVARSATQRARRS